MEAYCVKDKKMVQIKNPKAITMKNGTSCNSGHMSDLWKQGFRIGKS